MAIKDWNGFKKNGNSYIPNDATARAGVIANTKLIKDTVGWSAKQKIPFPYADGYSKSLNGVTWTVDSNGVVTANTGSGSSTDSQFGLVIYPNKLLVKAGKYILTGGHTPDKVVFVYDGTSFYTDYGEGRVIEFANDAYVEIAVRLKNGQTANNEKFYPMLRDANILDDTYEPYFGSTAFPRSEQAVLGAGNFLPNNLVTETVQDVTITVNDDKTFSTSGTNSGATIFRTVGTILNPKIGTNFILTGCPSGGGANTYDLYCVCRDSSNTEILIGGDAGSGYSFTVPANTVKIEVALRIQASINMADKIFKPMIALSADAPYAPYAMTNRELTEKVVKHSLIDITLPEAISKNQFEEVPVLSSYDLRNKIPEINEAISVEYMWSNGSRCVPVNQYLSGRHYTLNLLALAQVTVETVRLNVSYI